MNKTESRDITKRIIIEFEREDKTLYLDELNKIIFTDNITQIQLFKAYLSSTSIEKIIYIIHDLLEGKRANSVFLNIESKVDKSIHNFKNPNLMKFIGQKEINKDGVYSMTFLKMDLKSHIRIEFDRNDLEDFLDNLYNTFVDYF